MINGWLFIAVFGTELIFTWLAIRVMLWDYNQFNKRSKVKKSSKYKEIFKRDDNYPFT